MVVAKVLSIGKVLGLRPTEQSLRPEKGRSKCSAMKLAASQLALAFCQPSASLQLAGQLAGQPAGISWLRRCGCKRPLRDWSQAHIHDFVHARSDCE